MIKINLARKRKFAASADAGAGGKFSLGRLGITKDDLKELPFIRIGICLLAAWLATDGVERYKNALIDVQDKAVKELQGKQQEQAKELAKVKDYDVQRKQLESDEAVLKGKIDAIQKLVSDRLGLYNSLYAISTSIPADVWLTVFDIKSDLINIQGASLDINQVSDFMKKLNETPYFSDITLKKTSQVRDQGGNELANFEIGAKRRP